MASLIHSGASAAMGPPEVSSSLAASGGLSDEGTVI
jgi:hypothetical protein